MNFVWFWFWFYVVLKIENQINQNYYVAVFPDANCKFCSSCLGFWVKCRRQIISLDFFVVVFCMIIANERHILF